MRLQINNARIIDPSQNLNEVTSLYIARGKFVGIGQQSPEGFSPDQEIDASDKWILPGLVDLSARLGEPGSQYQGNIQSETQAAVAGGITTLCCLPDTNPVNDSQAVTELIRRRARQAATAFVLPIGALTQNLQGERLSNMAALKQAGCVAVSQADQPIQNPLTLKNAMSYAASQNILLMIRCEDALLKNHGVAHSGVISSRLGLADIPASAETTALARDLLLVEETGVSAHFSKLSTARSVEMISDAKQRGLNVTCDVAIHQLILTEYDVIGFGSQFHVTPPLRSHSDRDALIYGIKSGVIDAIVSDHTPLGRDDKLLPFGESAPGISGLETLLPLLLKLVEDGVLELMTAIKCVTQNPAKILNVKTGSLHEKHSADFSLINPNQDWQLQNKTMLSEGKYTPFTGWHFSAKVETTYFQGRPVFRI